MFARLRPLAPILALAPVLGLAPGASRAATLVDSTILAPKAFVDPEFKVPADDGFVFDTGEPKTPAPETLAFATEVPEPAAWTLMILGFGLVGASARRRRTAVASL